MLYCACSSANISACTPIYTFHYTISVVQTNLKATTDCFMKLEQVLTNNLVVEVIITLILGTAIILYLNRTEIVFLKTETRQQCIKR